MKNLTYSEFCLWIDENDDKVEYILEYDDWSVVLIDGRYYYYEHDERRSDKFFEVEPIAQLYYSIINDIKATEIFLSCLFDCDMCGEQVCDDELVYWWFKEV